MSGNHPLPAPPGHQDERLPGRQRAASGFSLHSHKSSGSGQGQKITLSESHDEKQSRRLTTHADPSMAMTEAEPSAVAREKSSLAPIRSIQHRDHLGNPIADPDRSNPTRSRWERPLDTIRSFEAAIDGNYSRKSYIRSETSDGPANFNRRSSYFGGTQVTTDEKPRFSQISHNSYYGGRPQSHRPDSFVDGRGGYYNQGDNGQGPSNGYYPNRARYPRTASEPQFNGGQGVYPSTGNQQSYETVNSASGSGSSGEQPGYSTDPSSENLSMDRNPPLPPMKESDENYAFIGFNGAPENRYNNLGVYQGGLQEQRQGNAGQRPTVLVRKEISAPRVPIKLGQTSGNIGADGNQRPAASEKRKSWFGRRFSKTG